MVHNGVIWNDDIVSRTQQKDGINYVSIQPTGAFNDSEVLMYDIAQYIEGETDKLHVEGSIAFIMVQRNKDGKPVALFFGRNEGSPLKLTRFQDGFSLTSEGSTANIKANTLFRFDYETKEFSEEPLEIPYFSYNQTSSTPYSGDYRGYGYGYDWGPSDEDDDRREMDDYNAGFGISPQPLVENTLDRFENYGRYGLNQDQLDTLEQGIVQDIIDALRYDTYQSGDANAADFGEELLEELKSAYLLIENKFNNDDDVGDDEVDMYLGLDNKIHLLTLAVDKLKKPNQLMLQYRGGSQSTRYTPDH